MPTRATMCQYWRPISDRLVWGTCPDKCWVAEELSEAGRTRSDESISTDGESACCTELAGPEANWPLRKASAACTATRFSCHGPVATPSTGLAPLGNDPFLGVATSRDDCPGLR